MNKPERFNDVLDVCLERMLFGGATLEQCLRDFPQHASGLKPLLETARAARQASAVQPRPEFKERARREFNAAVREAGSKKAGFGFVWGWRSGWAVAVSGVLIVALGGGTVAAASGSMPDSLLYPVKLAAEQAQLAFTFSDIAKAELHAHLADKRVSEMLYLAENDQPEKLDKVSQGLNKQLSGISLLASLPAPAASIMMAEPAAERAVAPQDAAPPALAPTPTAPSPAPLPAAAQQPASSGAAEAAKETPSAPELKVSKEAASSPAGDNKTDKKDSKEDRKSQLKKTMTDQYEVNIARLRAQLEKAPESAKPALRKALEQAEKDYDKAIKALD